MKKEKLDIITFKVPESLRDAMKGIPNRSEFIRTALVAALDSICPLCKGTGVMMPNQRPHWEKFVNDHHFEECGTCSAVHVVCEHSRHESVHPQEAT
jgi:hypothetical protein